jgi:putative FmdB family regulatory protein
MPLYDYRCAACGAVTEIRHGFNDTHTEPCATCGGALTRVFNPAPIVFKGSGFYVTDSRPSSSGGTESAGSSGGAASTGNTGSTSTPTGTGSSPSKDSAA